MAVFLSRSIDLPTCRSSTARRQPSEDRFARGGLIEMVGLGIEFSADHPDPLLLDPHAAGAKRPPTGGPNSGTAGHHRRVHLVPWLFRGAAACPQCPFLV